MKTLITFLSLVLLINVQTQAQLIINEVCYDPSNVGLEGDANGDGEYDQTQDEFIEFVNRGTTNLDISGYRISDRVLATGEKTVRHTVAQGTILPPNGAFVVFGGGETIGTYGGAIVVIDVGSAGLSLQNSGESVIVEDSSGNFVDSLDTDALSDNPNESYTRNPDVTGNYIQHTQAFSGKLFSPGTRLDGTPFSTFASVRASSTIHSFKLWPNPATSKVRFGLNNGEQCTFEIINATGNMIGSEVSSNGLIDVNTYQNGMYILKATVNEKVYSTRLMIAR